MKPVAMAFGKGVIAVLCLMALVLPTGLHFQDNRAIGLLALSGIAGISLGDTLYFATLNRLGARITLLLGTLIPVCTALSALVIFEESINAHGWAGILIILAGIALVLWERNAENTQPGKHLGSGLLLAAGFVLANTAGILLTKAGVTNMGSLEATFWRETAAVLALGLWGGFCGNLTGWLQPVQDRRLLVPLVVAAVVGTFLGTWFSVAALKYTWVGIAATLNATSPLFILPLAALFLHEKITGKALLGALISVSGIALYYISIV